MTCPPLRVVHAVLSLDVGGLERIVLDLVRAGQARGQQVSVVCLERPGLLAAECTADVHCLHKPPGRQRRTVEQTVRGAGTLLDRLHPDVVHTHQVGPLWYLGQAARACGGPPFLHTEHVDNVEKAVGWRAKVKTRLLWNRAARYADTFCCVSDDVSRSAGRWGTVAAHKLAIVLNGIDTDRYAQAGAAVSRLRAEVGIPAGSVVVGTVGRLHEVKRQDLLLRAAARLRATRPGLHVLIVGDGPERARLEALAADLGIRPAVTFTGFQTRPERLLPAMDVFALTSRLEGLPLAMLEAWAAGVPVVSTAVGGIPKALTDGVTGRLVPNGDERAVAEALSAVLDDPFAAGQMSARGRDHVVARYSLNRMADEYAGYYHRAIERRRGGRATRRVAVGTVG
jgi:glycosyltransferase involved in cell wall biosynthesis